MSQGNGEEYIVVFMTAPGEDEAASIGRSLVEEELVACCNIVPNLRSIYRWKGKIFDEQEVLCIMKTKRALFSKLSKRVKELHSYDVPELISLAIDEGSEDYLKWIKEVTS